MFNPFILPYANDIDAFIPEIWAQESLMILEENMVAGALVHRDFQDQIANFGDVVNTRKPADFTAVRKTNADDVTVQDAIATNVQVPLDQHVHTSFLIRDGEESKSFKDLVNEFLRPAMIAQARFIDQVVLGQVYQFIGSRVGGHLGLLSSTTAKDYILEARQALNQQKCPVSGRNLILTPNSETELLKLDLFLGANTVGDDGTALKEASLGRKLGFDTFMCQNTSSVTLGALPTVTGAINHSGGYKAGTSGALAVDVFSTAVATGEWLTIGGDESPYQITAHAETLGATTSITLNRPLRRDVADDAVIVVVESDYLVNNASNYAAGYAKEIAIDTGSAAIPVGAQVSFGSATDVYSIVAVDGIVGITLDRPLKNAVNNNVAVRIGPSGDYNFAFHRNALALVVRPLAQPRPGTGALSAVANYNNLSMRTTITYDGTRQGHLFTLDMLCGVAVLDANLGVGLLG